jgi:alpha-D-ribose 1-methylphosphonate 5-triphosphate synthase subunit PhnH
VRRDRALHRAFRAVLAALAQPGRAFDGPLVDGVDAARRTATLAIEAIWDAATPMHFTQPALPLRFEARAEAADAAGVIVVEGGLDAATVSEARRGSEELPEDGATIVCIGGSHVRTPVRLRGPGIDGETVVALPLAPAALAAREEACARYPLGIDLVFFESDGRIAGLPRTTRVEVLT